MPDFENIRSRPYRPKMACPACCFGADDHAKFCKFWDEVWDEGDVQDALDRADCLAVERENLLDAMGSDL